MTNFKQENTQNMQTAQNMPMGNSQVSNGNICKKCGTVVGTDKKFCTTCGEPMMQYVSGGNNKKKILPLVIILCTVIVILIGLIIGGVVILNNSDNNDSRKDRNHRISRDDDSDDDSDDENETSPDENERNTEDNTEEIYTIPDIGEIPSMPNGGNGEDDNTDYSEREAKLLAAAKEYSQAFTVRIITSKDRIYTIECIKLENNIQNSELLYIDINTFVGTDQLGNIVNLNPYTDSEIDDDNMEPQTADFLYQVTVNASDGYVNMRTGPGTTFDIIQAIDNGIILDIYEEAEGGKWLRTKYNDNEGWIAASQVKRANIP